MRSIIDTQSMSRVHIGLETKDDSATLILESRSNNTRVEKTFTGRQRQLAINAFNGMSLAAIDGLFGNAMRNVQVVPMTRHEKREAA